MTKPMPGTGGHSLNGGGGDQNSFEGGEGAPGGPGAGEAILFFLLWLFEAFCTLNRKVGKNNQGKSFSSSLSV